MIITAGKLKGRKVVAPDENITRPTLSKAREAIFSVLFSLTAFDEKSFLDMFAGSGIMGLEAISRGFESVLAVEKNPKVAKILKDNYKSLGLEADIVIADSIKLKTDKNFDVIYVDPPYMSGIYENVLGKIANDNLLKTGGIVVLEHVIQIDWQKFGFELIKQKSYSKKLITFLQIS